MKKLPFRRKPLEITIHTIIWFLVFCFPLMLTEWGSKIDWEKYLRHSIVPFCSFLTFYINYLYLICDIMKIAIIGYAGSGKSTLADYLSKKYHLPLLHIDKISFHQNWVEKTNGNSTTISILLSSASFVLFCLSSIETSPL